MTSAYGLMWSLEHKEGYLERFWSRRLPQILIPALIANAFGVIVKGINDKKIKVLSFFNIDNWVKVLLLYYVLFWFIYYVASRIIKNNHWKELLICVIIVSFSLVSKFTSLHITYGWIVEPMGFAIGIVLANNKDVIQRFLLKKRIIKSAFFAVVSVSCGIAYLKFKSVVFWGDYLLKILLSVFISLLIFEILTWIKFGNKINHFIGSISYEVYILHRSVFILVELFFGTINSGLFIICSITITIILACLLKKFCILVINKTRCSLKSS